MKVLDNPKYGATYSQRTRQLFLKYPTGDRDPRGQRPQGKLNGLGLGDFQGPLDFRHVLWSTKMAKLAIRVQYLATGSPSGV